MVESEGVLKKGWLMKRSQQLLQWRWRFVSLTRGRLLTYTTVKEDVLTNEVELEGVEVEEAEFYLAAPLKYGFMVTTRDRTLRFAADTVEVREAWIQAIAGAFQEAARTVEPSPVVPELPAEEPKAPAPKAPKGKGKGPKGKGPGKGPKGKGPPPKQGKGVPKKASALPLGRRLSVQMLAPERAATGNGEDAEEGDEEGDTSDLRPLALDVEALQQTFGTSKASSVKQMPKPHHEAGLALLPRKEAQNVAIVLKSLRLDTEGLAASLDQLQPGDCPLPAEECERFIQVLPAPELLRPLQEYKEETSKLRDIERELLPLAKLTRLRERLRLLGLFKTLDQRMADAMQQMCTLQGACSEVRKSSVLRNLLEIIEVLFNYVNYGQSPDTAPEQPTGSTLPKRRKVDVQSLTHLVETKSDPERAPFPKFHMLHWCVQQLLKQRPEFTFAQLEEELKDLSPASFVNLAHQHLALQRLKEDLEFVKTELYGHRQEYQKKEEVEQQETPQNTLVKFDLEENDTASEDEIGREMSEDSVPRTPTRSPKRSSLGQLVSHAIDTFSFAEDWWHGSAIVGINEKGGLDAVLAADGAPPPPGMMHRWRPSGRCKPYLCEVRGALLVLYRVKKIRTTASLKGTFYVVLPGAEIAMLESLYASDFARNLAREKSSSGFELRPVDGRAEYFLTKNSKEADRWMDFLQTRTQQWDGGFISHYVGWGFISSCWKRLFCIIDRPNKKLLGYSHVRDYAEGSKPEHSWELSNSCSCAFDAEKSSATAKGLLSAAPVGFEIILENQRLQFSCDSVQHLHCWLEELQHFGEAAVAGRSQERLDTEAFGGAELFDLFADPSPNGGPRPNLSFSVVEAAAPATPTASPSNGSQLRRRLMLSVGVTGDEPAEDQRVERANSDDEELHPALAATSSFCALADAAGGTEGASGATRAESGGCALSQLRQLEVEMEGVVEQWTRTFAATEADCRALLKYFGLSGKGQLHEATQDLLQALKTFQQQLRVAWADLEKHQEKSKTSRRLRPSPAVGTSLPEAPSASESEGTKSGDCGDLRENPVEESFISVCSEDDQ